jgi:hypothetical protein
MFAFCLLAPALPALPGPALAILPRFLGFGNIFLYLVLRVLKFSSLFINEELFIINRGYMCSMASLCL